MTTARDYFDYRFRVPVAGLDQAMAVLSALRQAGMLAGQHPTNMLGDPMSAAGTIVSPDDAVFMGRQSGEHIYVHVRSAIDPAALAIDLTSYGLEPVSAEDSAAVLGVWA